MHDMTASGAGRSVVLVGGIDGIFVGVAFFFVVTVGIAGHNLLLLRRVAVVRAIAPFPVQLQNVIAKEGLLRRLRGLWLRRHVR
jgi:hypothetical protein